MQYKTEVVGSTGVIYTITINIKGENINYKCTCDAGIHSKLCKHRIEIAKGNLTNALNPITAEEIHNSISTHETINILNEISKKEKEAEDIKNAISSLKRKLGKIWG